MFKRLEREEDLAIFLAQNQERVRLIKFSAEWCPPCRELHKNLNELIKENPQVVILEVDVEKFSHLAQQPEFQVNALPTLLLFRLSSTEAEKKTGLQSLPQLKEWIKDKARSYIG